MEDKLIEVIKVQSEIIEILGYVYTDSDKSPMEKDRMRILLSTLKNLEKQLIE